MTGVAEKSAQPREAPVVFISYRHADANGTMPLIAALLANGLTQSLRNIEVFVDHRSIDGGEQWPRKLLAQVSSAAIVVALIGKQWETSGTRTSTSFPLTHPLQDPNDWVRRELSTAVRSKKTILPILVQRDDPPNRQFLNTCGRLRELANLNAMKLRGADLLEDLGKISSHISGALASGLVDPNPPGPMGPGELAVDEPDTDDSGGSERTGEDKQRRRLADNLKTLLEESPTDPTDMEAEAAAVQSLRDMTNRLSGTASVLDAYESSRNRRVSKMEPSLRTWLWHKRSLVLATLAAVALGGAGAAAAQPGLLGVEDPLKLLNALAHFGQLGLVIFCLTAVSSTRVWRGLTGGRDTARTALLANWKSRSVDAATYLRRADQARDQFRTPGWLGVWVAWTLLYATLAARFASLMPDHTYLNRVIVESLLCLFNNAASGGLFVAFWVLSHATTDSSERSMNSTMWRLIGGTGFVILLLFAIQLSFASLEVPLEGLEVPLEGSETPPKRQNDTLVYTNVAASFISGMAGGIIHAALLGRLDSKFIGMGRWTLICLYFYATLQPLYPFISHDLQPPDDALATAYDITRAVSLCLALGLKALLFFVISWIAKTGRLDFYLLHVRALHETLTSNWSDLTDVAQAEVDTNAEHAVGGPSRQ